MRYLMKWFWLFWSQVWQMNIISPPSTGPFSTATFCSSITCMIRYRLNQAFLLTSSGMKKNLGKLEYFLVVFTSSTGSRWSSFYWSLICTLYICHYVSPQSCLSSHSYYLNDNGLQAWIADSKVFWVSGLSWDLFHIWRLRVELVL